VHDGSVLIGGNFGGRWKRLQAHWVDFIRRIGRRTGDATGAPMTALGWSAPLLPFFIALLLVGFNIGSWNPATSQLGMYSMPLVIGVAAAVWAVGSLLLYRLVVVGPAARSMSEIEQRLDSIRANLDARLSVHDGPWAIDSVPEGSKMREARRHYAAAVIELSGDDRIRLHLDRDELTPELTRSSHVVRARSVAALWTRVHRAEEALFALEPTEVMIGHALADQLRIRDSNIPNREELLLQSRESIAYLREQARKE